MRTIGLTFDDKQEVTKEEVVVTAETTKAGLIAQAEADGIELTAAEKRLSKEKLAALITSKKNNE